MIKKLLLFGGVILVVVGIGLAAVVLYIDAIAKTAVERNATYALGVTTSLHSADVRILRGEFAMSGLNVANPEGYSSSLSRHVRWAGGGHAWFADAGVGAVRAHAALSTDSSDHALN